MSIRAAFGIGFGIGLTTAALFGTPLAPAIVYGVLTGAFSAAVAALPPVQNRIAVIQRPPIFTRRYWGWDTHTHVVTAAPQHRFWHNWNRPSHWFPSRPTAPHSMTTVHQTPSGVPVQTTVAPTALGGTRNRSITALPPQARNVHTNTTLFANNESAARSTVVNAPSSILRNPLSGAVPPQATNVHRSTTLLNPTSSSRTTAPQNATVRRTLLPR